MITALISACRGPQALGTTFAALIPAVAEGVIGDAVVIAPKADPQAEAITEGLGARLVVASGDPWWHGGALAKRDWLLCLEDGDVLAEGWIRAVEHFVATSPPERRFGRPSRRPIGFAAALADAMWLALGRPGLRSGDVIHRSLLVGPGRPGRRPARIGAVVQRDPVFG